MGMQIACPVDQWRLRRWRFDTLSGGLRRALVDQSTIVTVVSELENDSGGLWWTTYPLHGIQKVTGSNPLGSTSVVGSTPSGHTL